jgi:hypothetical protein
MVPPNGTEVGRSRMLILNIDVKYKLWAKVLPCHFAEAAYL